MKAKSAGRNEAVRMLKAAGAKDSDCVAYAAFRGNLAAVKSFLAQTGAGRPSQHELDGALSEAVNKRDTAMVKELLAHSANPNAKSAGDFTAFIGACSKRVDEKGGMGIARQLLAAGADVNQARKGGVTPLMYAAVGMPTEFVEELIAKGARVNAAMERGGTAIRWAVMGGKIENIEVLLKHGADINDGGISGFPSPPLVQAIRQEDKKVIEFLLSHGANVNVRSAYGITPLRVAVSDGNVEIVKLLLAHGADATAKADYDYHNTALKLAEHSGKPEMIKLLRDALATSRK